LTAGRASDDTLQAADYTFFHENENSDPSCSESSEAGSGLSPLPFDLVLEYAIRKDLENCLELNGTNQLLVYADVNM
jgi:hypothetical protein